MEKEKKPRGRPSTIDKDSLAKLEVAFKAGMTDAEACATAGITTDALYRYQRQNADFATKKAAWKKALIGTAKLVIAADISVHRNVKTAQWLIDRESGKNAAKLARELTKAQAEKAKADAELARVKANAATDASAPITVNVTLPPNDDEVTDDE